MGSSSINWDPTPTIPEASLSVNLIYSGKLLYMYAQTLLTDMTTGNICIIVACCLSHLHSTDILSVIYHIFMWLLTESVVMMRDKRL